MLWRNSLVMMDEETGSLWSHVIGKALQGPLKGKILKTLPAVQTTWASWVKRHPKTKVLKKNEDIWSSTYEKYFKNPNRLGLFRTFYLKDRMPGKTLIYGVSSGAHQLAVLDSALVIGKPLQTRLGENGIIIFKSIDGGVRVYLNDRFIFIKEKNGRDYKDSGTDSLWDLERGICIKGKLKGTRLDTVPVTVAYWFAWSTYFPNTDVLD